MNNYSFQEKKKERQILVKFGSVFKKKVIRWYSIFKQANVIVYYQDKESQRSKGVIDLCQIEKVSLTPESSQPQMLLAKSSYRSLSLQLKSKKKIYLFEQNLEKVVELLHFIEKLINDKKAQIDAKEIDVSAIQNREQLLSSDILPLFKEQEIINLKLCNLDSSDVMALMPESLTERRKEQCDSLTELGDGSQPIGDEANKLIPHLSKNGQQRKHKIDIIENGSEKTEMQKKNERIKNKQEKKVKNNDQIEKRENQEEQYMKFNDEIMEELSKEETENTNRAHVFVKYQSSNDTFQIQKIKKQIYHSSNSLCKSMHDSSMNLTKNNINNLNYPLICSSYNNNNNNNNSFDQTKIFHNQQSNQLTNFSRRISTFNGKEQKTTDLIEESNVIEHKQIEGLAHQASNSEGFKNILLDSVISKGNTYKENQSSKSYWQLQSSVIKESTHKSLNKQASVFSMFNGEPQNLSSHKKKNYESDHQCRSETQKKSQNSLRMSVSEVETESNLASIKQFQGDMKGKHNLQETFAQELRGCFRAQTFLYQEFNTLISLNTQYLGSATNSKKNSVNVSEKNRRRQGGEQSFAGETLRIWEESSGDCSVGFSDQDILTDKEVNKISKVIKNYSHSGGFPNCFKFQETDPGLFSPPSARNTQNPRIQFVPIEKYQQNKQKSEGQTLIESDSRMQIEIEDEVNDVQHVEEYMKAIEVSSRSIKLKSEPDFLLHPIMVGQNGASVQTRSPSVSVGTKVFPASQFDLNISERNMNMSFHNYSNSYNVNNNNDVNNNSNNNNNNNNTINITSNNNNNNNNNINHQNNPSNHLNSMLQPQMSSIQIQSNTVSVDNIKSCADGTEEQNSESNQLTQGKKIQLAVNYLMNFEFLKAQQALESCTQQDTDVILCHIYVLLIQFFCSLKTELLDQIFKQCEIGVDIILQQRFRKNEFISLSQDIYLAEIYIIKGIILFSLEKKIQGLLSLKNGYKYFQKCLRSQPDVLRSLASYHKQKIEILEGLYNLAACALQESYRKVLSFFVSSFDSQRGLFLLSQIISKHTSSSTFCQASLVEQKAEYLKLIQDKSEIDISSHIAVCSLTLFYIWREKNAQPVIKIVQNYLKQYPSSPIYLWLSYLANFEIKENVKALAQINKALLKCHIFRPQCIALKFEKAGFLISNLLWKEASQLYGPIAVQLFAFDGFKNEIFLSILKKNGLNSSSFYSFYRSKQLEFKPEKIFFIGVSNLLLSQAATLISLGDIQQAKEWFLLSQYFKKNSYLGGFINQDMHELSKIYLKRKMFSLVKYEIMYFTKIITKVPSEMIYQILSEVELQNQDLLNTKNEQLSKDQIKAQAVEKASLNLLKILIGCLLCDTQIIKDSEEQLDTLENFSRDKKYSENQYLMHHAYYWIAKFYMLSSEYSKSMKNLKSMSKYSSKIFSLQNQADNILKDIQTNQRDQKE